MCRTDAFNHFLKEIIGCLVGSAERIAGFFPSARAEKFCGDLGRIAARKKFLVHDVTARRDASSSTFAVRFRILETSAASFSRASRFSFKKS